MSGTTTTALASVWDVNRAFVLALGHALHQILPAGDPPIVLTGRDLRRDTEGVGFQFQFLLEPLDESGAMRAAYYVTQLRLQPRRATVAWHVDSLPVIDAAGRGYNLFDRRSFTVPLRDRARLRAVLLDDVAADAAAFFAAVRAGTVDTLRSTAVVPATVAAV